MKFDWSPHSPLEGSSVFLSGSVPSPERDSRFLDGPLEGTLMLRVIDRRVFDAVQSLVAQVLKAGGRIVHGGQPRITSAIANQANNWNVSKEQDPPIIIYQSEFFRNQSAPPGREEMQRAGFASVRWTPMEVRAVADRFAIDSKLILKWLPEQAAPTADGALREALLAMRLQMLLESQPSAAVSIGGMEGIQAEASLYLHLAELKLIPWADRVNVIGSTYGAASKLESAGINIADYDKIHWTTPVRTAPRSDITIGSAETHRMSPLLESRFMKQYSASKRRVTGPSMETAKVDIQTRVSYDRVMGALVEDIAKKRKDQDVFYNP
jgi:hypothetical protein